MLDKAIEYIKQRFLFNLIGMIFVFLICKAAISFGIITYTPIYVYLTGFAIWYIFDLTYIFIKSKLGK